MFTKKHGVKFEDMQYRNALDSHFVGFHKKYLKILFVFSMVDFHGYEDLSHVEKVKCESL